MEVVGEVIDPDQLISVVETTGAIVADVIIIASLDSIATPKLRNYLLAKYPKLKIVTLSSAGEVALLYQTGKQKQRIEEPSGQSLIEIIRKAMQ